METQKNLKIGEWQQLWGVADKNENITMCYTRKNEDGTRDFGICDMEHYGEIRLISFEDAMLIGNATVEDFTHRIEILEELGIAELTEDNLVIN